MCHTYLIITITGNGPEEIGAPAPLISVSRKHTGTYLHAHTHTHSSLVSFGWGRSLEKAQSDWPQGD